MSNRLKSIEEPGQEVILNVTTAGVLATTGLVSREILEIENLSDTETLKWGTSQANTNGNLFPFDVLYFKGFLSTAQVWLKTTSGTVQVVVREWK